MGGSRFRTGASIHVICLESPCLTSISTRVSIGVAALALGGVTAGGLLSAGPLSAVAQASGARARSQAGKLPAKRIQEIVGAEGTVSSGVLSIDIARKDIGDSKGPLGVTFTPSFEIDGTLTFQPLGHRLAFFNGDLPLRGHETNPFIDAIIANVSPSRPFTCITSRWAPRSGSSTGGGSASRSGWRGPCTTPSRRRRLRCPRRCRLTPSLLWTTSAWRRSCAARRRSATRAWSPSTSTGATGS